MSDRTKADPLRREFLLRVGAGAGAAAIVTQGVASLRALVPNVSYDAPTRVKLGAPAGFSEGLTFLPDQRLFVVRQHDTFHAISAVCTHLGCTVRAEALASPITAPVGGVTTTLTHRFLCPCHGSQYRGDGVNVAGPAPRPLAWYRLWFAADDGQLIVDLDDAVGRDFRLGLA